MPGELAHNRLLSACQGFLNCTGLKLVWNVYHCSVSLWQLAEMCAYSLLGGSSTWRNSQFLPQLGHEMKERTNTGLNHEARKKTQQSPHSLEIRVIADEIPFGKPTRGKRRPRRDKYVFFTMSPLSREHYVNVPGLKPIPDAQSYSSKEDRSADSFTSRGQLLLLFMANLHFTTRSLHSLHIWNRVLISARRRILDSVKSVYAEQMYTFSNSNRVCWQYRYGVTINFEGA